MISDGCELDRFKELTWEAIEEWAGSRTLSRGRSYQRGRRVDELTGTLAGSLIATVRGGEAYTTLVEFQEGELVSRCTCPYGESCKHAVAVAARKGDTGTAHTLINTLREMREKENNWLSVATIRADEFFSGPSFDAYDVLRHASKLAGAWVAVRKMVLLYLETGKLPFADVSWPLPVAEAKIDRPSRQDKPPMVHVLIEVAMDEKQPDEVVKWYDFPGRKGGHFRGWSEYMEDRIAQAVEKAYPDPAVAIWKGLAEGQIAYTSPRPMMWRHVI